MNHLIAKIKGRGDIYQKVLTGKKIFEFPDSLEDSVEYDPGYLLDEEQWYRIDNFSEKEFCIKLLQGKFNSADYDMLGNIDANNMEYLCSYQNKGEYYFQKIPKAQLLSKKWVHIGDAIKFEENNKCIVINCCADAVYIKANDRLFFKDLSCITSIFKGIDELYRIATEYEIETFLKNDFICLGEDYSAGKVKIANRRRIAMALDTLNGFEEEQRGLVFNSIKEYCPTLVTGDGQFIVKTETDLKLLLFGIEQRFYTTPDGREKRMANSVIKME